MTSRAPEPDAQFDRIEHLLKLNFPTAYRSQLLELLASKSDQLRRSRSPTGAAAAAECQRVEGAAKILIQYIAGVDDGAVDWPNALRGHCIVTSFLQKPLPPILGSDLTAVEWQREMLRLIRCLADLSKQRAEFHDLDRRAGGAPRHDNEVQFANCLADHFVRAGGKFENAGKSGKAGFPAFLKLVWELLPADCRPPRASSFSSTIARLVDKDDMAEKSVAKANYCIDLTKSYWS